MGPGKGVRGGRPQEQPRPCQPPSMRESWPSHWSDPKQPWQEPHSEGKLQLGRCGEALVVGLATGRRAETPTVPAHHPGGGCGLQAQGAGVEGRRELTPGQVCEEETWGRPHVTRGGPLGLGWCPPWASSVLPHRAWLTPLTCSVQFGCHSVQACQRGEPGRWASQGWRQDSFPGYESHLAVDVARVDGSH